MNVGEVRPIVGGGDPVQGMVVHKIGRTTGRTVGTVQQTCVHLTVYINQQDSGRTLLCQYVASYSSSGGDSGSPVVEVWPDGSLIARGIHWRDGGGFSSINEVLRELREVTGGGLGTTISDGQ